MQRGPLVPVLDIDPASLAIVVVAVGVGSHADAEVLDEELEPLLVRVAGAEVQHRHSPLVATSPTHLHARGQIKVRKDLRTRKIYLLFILVSRYLSSTKLDLPKKTSILWNSDQISSN